MLNKTKKIKAIEINPVDFNGNLLNKNKEIVQNEQVKCRDI